MAMGSASGNSAAAGENSSPGSSEYRPSIRTAMPEELRLSMSSNVGAAAALESKTTCFFIRPPLIVDALISSKKLFGCRVNRSAHVQIPLINHPLDPGLVRGTRYWLLLPCE